MNELFTHTPPELELFRARLHRLIIGLDVPGIDRALQLVTIGELLMYIRNGVTSPTHQAELLDFARAAVDDADTEQSCSPRTRQAVAHLREQTELAGRCRRRATPGRFNQAALVDWLDRTELGAPAIRPGAAAVAQAPRAGAIRATDEEPVQLAQLHDLLRELIAADVPETTFPIVQESEVPLDLRGSISKATLDAFGQLHIEIHIEGESTTVEGRRLRVEPRADPVEGRILNGKVVVSFPFISDEELEQFTREMEIDPERPLPLNPHVVQRTFVFRLVPGQAGPQAHD